MLCRKPQTASSNYINVHNYHEHDWSSLLNSFTYVLINVSLVDVVCLASPVHKEGYREKLAGMLW